MAALTTLLPVFFMMFLGALARKKNILTPEMKEGANTIVFSILFPFMVFNVLFTSRIQSSTFFIVVYVLIVFVVAILVGKLVSRFTGKKFAHITPFLMTTVEGGNLALPLYVSIVGMSYAMNTITFDIAGLLTSFAIVPVLVARKTSENASAGAIIKKVFTNPLVIAIILAIAGNLLGLYDMLSNSAFIGLYENIISYTTAPIIGLILIVLGYNLNISKGSIGAILKLLLVRFVFYALVILGFFVFFKDLMQDKNYLIGVIIYFMCPTGLGTAMTMGPLSKSQEDEDFKSAFISAGMILILVVYTLVVLFLA